MKKILIIPSWYPLTIKAGGGIFTMYESAVLQEKYDVKVLFAHSPYLEHRSLYGRYKKRERLKQEEAYGEPFQDLVPTKRIVFGSWWMGQERQLKDGLKKIRLELINLINNGWKPDLIYARCAETAGIFASALSEEFDIPWMLSEHQVLGLGNFMPFRQELMRKALRSADTLEVMTTHQLRCIAINNIYRPMEIIGHLIDEQKFLYSEPNIEKKPFQITSVMWDGAVKDPETFFRAIYEVVNRGYTDIKVVVIGKRLGSMDDISGFEKLIDKYQIQDYTQLIPKVLSNEMPKFYAETNVLVSTSIAETFGMTLREAMAVGRPVISTANGGIDDDIFDFNGLKVAIGDYKAVADAIISMINGQKSYDARGIREYVVSKYGRKAYLTKISNLIEKTIENHGKQ